MPQQRAWKRIHHRRASGLVGVDRESRRSGFGACASGRIQRKSLRGAQPPGIPSGGLRSRICGRNRCTRRTYALSGIVSRGSRLLSARRTRKFASRNRRPRMERRQCWCPDSLHPIIRASWNPLGFLPFPTQAKGATRCRQRPRMYGPGRSSRPTGPAGGPVFEITPKADRHQHRALICSRQYCGEKCDRHGPHVARAHETC